MTRKWGLSWAGERLKRLGYEEQTPESKVIYHMVADEYRSWSVCGTSLVRNTVSEGGYLEGQVCPGGRRMCKPCIRGRL